MKKAMVTIFIQNQNGILTRLMGLFAKHQFQIESLRVGYTDVEGTSKMTVIVEGGESHKFRQLAKQVEKQIEVLFLTDETDQQIIAKEFERIKTHSEAKAPAALK